MLIYKYVVLERIDVLKNGSIRFTQADALNDPFEIKPSFNSYRKLLKETYREMLKSAVDADKYSFIELESLLSNTTQTHINELRESLKKDFFVLSLTKERNNLAMWSHYTNAYQGFVIGFDSNNLFFQGKLPGLSPLYKIQYAEKRPNFGKSLNENVNKEAMYKIFLTKSLHWNYEEELRMFAQYNIGYKIEKKDENGFDIYLFKFPSECLKEIIFGYQMKPEKKLEISDIVENHYSHAKLFETKLSETAFDLDIKPYRRPPQRY
jgi:hypothetical protein